MSRILALSDTQIGGGRNLALDRLADQESVLNAIADLAASEAVDLVLHCGDVFDSRNPTDDARMVVKRFFDRIAEQCRVVVVAGNHCLRNAALASAVDLYDGCTFVREPRVFEVGDCALACLPWCPPGQYVAGRHGGNRDQANQEIGDLLVEVADGLAGQVESAVTPTTILALHWWISGATSPTGYGADPGVIREPAVIPLSGLTELGFDAVIAGHVHRPQVLHEGPPVFYCGPPSVCDWGEVGTKHGVWIFDTETLQRRYIEIPDRRFVTVDADLTEGPCIDRGLPYAEGPDETDRITAAIAEHFPLTDAVVRLRYRATAEQARRVDHAALRGLLADAGVSKLYAIQPEIVRSERARVEGVDETMDAHEALVAWTQSQGIGGEVEERLEQLQNRYLEEVAV
jgi:DNA repair protein SbcD/Mre11